MPDLDGISATRVVLAAFREVGVVIHPTFELHDYICGALRAHELAFLFGEEHSASVGSAAVVMLDQQLGALAIGSPDPQHYKSSLGTLFLGYIAEVLARVLPRFATPLRSVR